LKDSLLSVVGNPYDYRYPERYSRTNTILNEPFELPSLEEIEETSFVDFITLLLPISSLSSTRHVKASVNPLLPLSYTQIRGDMMV
jgi:hypothetical protein